MFCRYQVRCKACKLVLSSKIDTIEKHEETVTHVDRLVQRRNCHFHKDSVQKKAQDRLHAARVKYDRGTARQMAVLLHQSSKGRPMMDYPTQKNLQQHLLTDILAGVPDKLEDLAKSHVRTLVNDADKSRVEDIVHELVKNVGPAVLDSVPQMHWTGNAGWELLQAMGEVAEKKLMSELTDATFMSLSLDEASQHNTSVLSIHVYIINDKWERIPLFLGVRLVMCFSAT